MDEKNNINNTEEIKKENIVQTQMNELNEEQVISNEELNQEEIPEEIEEKKNYYWIFYILIVAVIFIIIILLLRGCNSVKNNKYNKIVSANDWVTNMWNKCVDPIYWYTVQGTGIEGASINIDDVLKNCDTYYKEYKSHNEEINSLGDEDKEFKEYYNKIMEQIDIIYPKIKASKPVAKVTTDYEENMELFYTYQVKLYDLVKEKYVEAD